MVKVSVVIPAYNEAPSIARLLDDVCITASRKPDQLVVVDAHSRDDTVRVVKLSVQAYPGKARNEGVSRAEYDYLAFIDCGVFPEEDWLEKLIKPVEQDPTVDLVWGRSFSLAATLWERAFAINCDSKRPIRAIRNSLITKKGFIQIGGFREDLRAAEDLVYVQAIRKIPLKEVFVPVDVWYSGYPETFSAALKKWRLYSEFNVYAGIYQAKLLLSFTEFSVFIIICGSALLIFKNIFAIATAMIMCLGLRGLIAILRSPHRLKSLSEFLRVVAIAIMIDIGRIWGLLRGLFQVMRKGNPGIGGRS
jgi:glycosyltransferase involved in cell wall biosynthesis